MAAGDIIYNQGISIIEAGSQPTWTPIANQSQWAKEANLPIFWYFDGAAWQRLSFDFNRTYTGSILNDTNTDLGDQLQLLETAIEAVQASINNDGNATNIVRTDAIEDVAPTAGEIATPEEGDTANVSLTSQKVEYWSYTGGAWAKAFVVDYSMVTIPVQTVADTNSIDLTLASNELSAALNLSATQDSEFALVESADGITLQRQTLPSYVSFAAAQADAGLAAGDAFVLTVNNLDGVPSDGFSAPNFRKQ